MKLTNLNRYQACASHLAVSLAIFAILVLCITQYWYPGILFDTGNGWKAITLIIVIDLILGPMLTLVVFNPKKSSLKFDLSVIACIQIIALVYGTWTIHSSRPLALAYINTSFITLYANAKNASDIKEKIEQLNSNRLFYIFDDQKPSQELDTDQFVAYKDVAKSVLSINSPYFIESALTTELLIQIDPLVSNNRYIIINKEDGSIIRFTDTPPSQSKAPE